MKTKRALVALVVGLLSMHRLEALALEMPKEIANVSIGMPVEELLATRPNIKKPRMDASKMKTTRGMLLEKFDKPEDFFSATYGIEDGKVLTIALMGSVPEGKEGGARRRVMKACIERWGKKFVRRAPEDDKRPGKAKATVTWLFDDVEAIVTLPRNRAKDDTKPNYFAIQFRPRSAIAKHPWKDLTMSDGEKKAFFKANDVDE